MTPTSIPCQRVRALLEDAVHGRLTPDAHISVERHVADCEACAAIRVSIERQRAVVAAFAPRPAAPPGLREAVLRDLGRSRRRAWLRPALVGAVAASLVLGVAFAALFAWSRPSAFERLAQEAVEDHIRVVLRSRTGASGPTKAHALVRLMEQVLDYRVPLPVAGGGPFVLAGGRPSYVLRQPIACFYYRTPAAYASLFVIPLDRLGGAGAPFAETPRFAERDAHRVAYWARAGYAYVLVSDAPSQQLATLVAAIQQS